MQVRSTDNVIVELHDLGGDGPPLLIAHATGFCAGAYRPMAATLTDQYHVWALDFRAHGDTLTPKDLELTWGGMADDVLAVCEALGGEPLRAFGHSMGGACLVAAELARPQTLAAAVLYEPIIIPANWGQGGADNALAAGARRRRNGFASREDALTRYASRPPLGTFRADALHDYVQHGFAEQPDGSVELKCSPEREAEVFEARGKPEIASLSAVEAPILVARGGRDGPAGPAGLAPLVVEQLPQAVLQDYPNLSHFGPFQDPDNLGRDVLDFLGKN